MSPLPATPCRCNRVCHAVRLNMTFGELCRLWRHVFQGVLILCLLSYAAGQQATTLMPESSNLESSLFSEVDEGEPDYSAPRFKEDFTMQYDLLRVAGESIKLKCPYTANPPAKVVWLKDNKLNWETDYLVATRITINGFKLLISRLTPDVDEGEYTCVISNEYGNISHTTRIGIEERLASRPIISEIPDQEVLVGSNATFECRVVSDLTPHVMWVKLENNNYTDLQASERLQIVADEWSKDLRHQCKDIMKNHLSNFTLEWKCYSKETVSKKINVQERSIEFYNVSMEEAGLYYCLAGNGLGISEEMAVLTVVPKRVASRPIISEIPDQEVLVGSNATFECRVVSDLTPQVMWVKLENNNYTDLQASERLQVVATVSKKINVYERSIEFYNVSMEEAGLYTCLAGNEVGVSEEMAVLTVVVPKTNRPWNLTITPIRSTAVTCNWNAPLQGGVYNYAIKYCKEKDASTCSTKHMFNKTSYNVTSLEPMVNYRFAVSIDDRPALTSQEVIGTGLSPRAPRILKQPVANITRREGQSVKFKCSIDSDPRANITWWKEGMRVDESAADKEVKRNSMSIKDLEEDDKGNYMCLASNSYGEVKVNFTLRVIVDQGESSNLESSLFSEVDEGEPDYSGPMMAPRFKEGFTMQYDLLRVAGESIKLKCPYTANPPAKVVWLKDNKLNWETDHLVATRITINDFKLLISRLTPDVDEGEYTCVISNEYGNISHTTRIGIEERVASRPIISEIPDQEVLVGSNATFECRVVSDLTPHVMWVKLENNNYTDLQASERLQIVADEWSKDLRHQCKDIMKNHLSNYTLEWRCYSKETVSKKINVQERSIEFYNVSMEEAGLYYCLAGNGLGISEEMAVLTVVPIPTRAPSSKPPKVILKPPDHWNQQKTVMIVSIACCSIILVLFFFIFIMCYKNNQRHTRNVGLDKYPIKSQLTRQLSSESNHSSTPLVIGRARLSSSLTVVSEYEVPLDPEWEFPRDRLTLGKALGEGAFGKVVLAEAVGISAKEQTTTVAVKMLKANATDRELSDLVSELEMMKMIGKHTNIINLLGCCTQDGPLYVVGEYARHGNLRDFLRLRRPPDNAEMTVLLPGHELLTNKDLISMSYQVARGMEFLASKKAIHRDLAARNVLVTDDYIMKIADFGLARDVHYIDFYKKTTDGRLPVKWMAPEALFDRVFTTQSDVWSFGILLWEIITLGGTPYPSVPVEKMFDYLKLGKRLEQPMNCSLEIYHIMRECWHTSPGQRPTFFDLVDDLARIISLSSNQDYLDLEALGDAPVTTFVETEFDSGNSSQHSRHSSESTV
ncbi:fibroblast growth factor receptor-like isoform X3 [Asterias amurensis]|uniref:fibroblast growth factor receptor-like isoform X3 n=1 Tax=Asterias amurensis TaxID=7602 RepID=UPI003AB2C952